MYFQEKLPLYALGHNNDVMYTNINLNCYLPNKQQFCENMQALGSQKNYGQKFSESGAAFAEFFLPKLGKFLSSVKKVCCNLRA